MQGVAWQSPFSPFLLISEDILHPCNQWLFSFRHLHLDHVEPPRDLPGSQPAQPLVRTPLNQGTLFPVHRREATHHRIFFTGFHLGEKELLSIPRHDIDFPAAPAFEISRQDFAAMRPQPVGGDFFPVVPRPLPCAARPRLRVVGRVEIPAETTDDDGDKAHVS